jgi:23S rRNA pseudouridine1911/1915/1917 synthase
LDDDSNRSEEVEQLDFVVAPAAAGERLDRYLGRELTPTYSRSYLAGLISAGKVHVNGDTAKPSYRILPGDQIAVTLEEPPGSLPKPEPIELSVIHEDAAVVVINKRPGLLMHPGPGTRSGTLVNGLLQRYPETARVGVAFRPGLVHRLDRDTSGIVVVARTEAAREALVRQFKNRTVKKEYRAIVVGKLPFDSDYIDLPLGKDPRHGDRMRVDLDKGKPSSTYYEVVERLPGFTFVRVMPFTGRTHQIRVHFSHLGFPVVADATYGKRAGQSYFQWRDKLALEGKPMPRLERHALHAYRIEFDHPLTGARQAFEAPLPEDMVELLEMLRGAR